MRSSTLFKVDEAYVETWNENFCDAFEFPYALRWFTQIIENKVQPTEPSAPKLSSTDPIPFGGEKPWKRG